MSLWWMFLLVGVGAGSGVGFAFGLRYAIRLSDILGVVLERAAGNTAAAVAYPGAVKEQIDQVTAATESLFDDEGSDESTGPGWMSREFDPFKVG